VRALPCRPHHPHRQCRYLRDPNHRHCPAPSGRMSAPLGKALLVLVRLLAGAQARWQGSAPERHQRIYFANHSSHLDTLVIMAALPAELRADTHPVAALDYWGTTAVRRYIAIECLNAVLVDRSGKAEDPLQPLGQLLDAGQSLILFPEG